MNVLSWFLFGLLIMSILYTLYCLYRAQQYTKRDDDERL